MTSPTKSSRAKKQKVKWPKRGIAIAAVMSLLAVVTAATQSGTLQQWMRQDSNLASPLPTDDAAITEAAPRRIYPYSIVSGGVQSSIEVARAMSDDTVVAAHYASDPAIVLLPPTSGDPLVADPGADVDPALNLDPDPGLDPGTDPNPRRESDPELPYGQTITPVPVPEPGTITLIGLGLAVGATYARRLTRRGRA